MLASIMMRLHNITICYYFLFLALLQILPPQNNINLQMVEAGKEGQNATRRGSQSSPLLVSSRSSTSSTSGSSRWLKKVAINQRPIGCWDRPWICNQGEYPPKTKRLCCKNRCIDVSSDVNNCGLCGIRCPFTWQCCRGICIDTNVNPFHCGRCDHKCPFLSFCMYGMCGYAQPLPPFPFPIPPIYPKPPFPFPPKPPQHPFPPKPPKYPPVLRGQPPPPPPAAALSD